MGYDTVFVKMLEKMSTATKDEITGMIDVNIDSFIKSGLEKVPERLVEKSLRFIEKIFRTYYTNLGTLDSKMSTYCRSVISRRFGQDSDMHILAKDIVKISYSEKGELLKKQRDSLIEKNKEVPTFTEEDVLKIVSLVDSENKFQKMIALLIASGSRPSEISHFSEYEAFGDNYVIQRGITKSKSLKEVTKPIIYMSAHKFVSEITILRSKFKGLKLKNEHNEGANPQIVSGCNKEINKIIGKFSCSTLREIYAHFSYLKFKDDRSVFKEGVSQLLWSNKVLGHSIGDFSITVHYNTINVKAAETVKEQIPSKEELFKTCSSQEKFWTECKSSGYKITRNEARDLFKILSKNSL